MPGTYATTGAVECTLCPVGFHCPYNATQIMVQCPSGTYANDTGQELCQVCPEGHECQTASHQPKLCHRGTYSTGGMSQCSPCPSGYYANFSGAVECEICPTGFECPIASNQPLACPAGTYRYV